MLKIDIPPREPVTHIEDKKVSFYGLITMIDSKNLIARIIETLDSGNKYSTRKSEIEFLFENRHLFELKKAHLYDMILGLNMRVTVKKSSSSRESIGQCILKNIIDQDSSYSERGDLNIYLEK